MSVENTLKFFKIAKPNPTPQDANVQYGVFLEELIETLEATDNSSSTDSLSDLSYNYKHSISSLNVLTDERKVDVLDGLCDTIVTAIGTARALGMDIVGAFDEVSKSNLSKFYYVGEGEITPQQLSEFTQDCVDIEKQGRYNEVCWERIGEYVVFFDMNNKILKSPRTYFEPNLKPFLKGE